MYWNDVRRWFIEELESVGLEMTQVESNLPPSDVQILKVSRKESCGMSYRS